MMPTNPTLTQPLSRPRRRTRMWYGAALALLMVVMVNVTGCSLNQINERYGPDGALVARSWNSHQLGTTRQSTMAMEQVDGAYNISTGENVNVDPQMVEIIRLPMNTVASMYGLSQARRAGAFAPGTVQQAGAQGFGMTPATQEQLEIYRERETTRRELARLQAELEAARAEALAAAEAVRQNTEASQPVIVQQPGSTTADSPNNP